MTWIGCWITGHIWGEWYRVGKRTWIRECLNCDKYQKEKD